MIPSYTPLLTLSITCQGYEWGMDMGEKVFPSSIK